MKQYWNAEQPQVSAILPCYNHSQYLPERIQSILNQTLPVSQIIFLDDASTDRSLELARQLLEGCTIDVVFHANSRNSRSPFAQWNTGVRLAEYSYVWIAETDDSCQPQLLEKLFSKFSLPGTVLSYAQSRYIDESGHDLGSALAYTDAHWPGAFACDFTMAGTAFNGTYMTLLNAIPNASAVLFRRDAYLKAGMANASMHFCGDWDTWIHLAEQGGVAFVAEELNRFRCHPSSTRSKGYTAEVAAEFLACRLRVCLGRNSARGIQPCPEPWRDKPITAVGLTGLLYNSPSRLVVALNSMSWQSLTPVRLAYQQLSHVPVLTPGAWCVIGCFHLLAAIGQRLRRCIVSLEKAIKRIPSAFGSPQS